MSVMGKGVRTLFTRPRVDRHPAIFSRGHNEKKEFAAKTDRQRASRALRNFESACNFDSRAAFFAGMSVHKRLSINTLDPHPLLRVGGP
jgi:hypothetical protein